MVYHLYLDNSCGKLYFLLFAPFYSTDLYIREGNLTTTIVFGAFHQSIFKGFPKIIRKKNAHFAIRIKEIRVYLPVEREGSAPFILIIHSISNSESLTLCNNHFYSYHIVIHKVLRRRIRSR